MAINIKDMPELIQNGFSDIESKAGACDYAGAIGTISALLLTTMLTVKDMADTTHGLEVEVDELRKSNDALANLLADSVGG